MAKRDDREFIDALRGLLHMEPLYPAPRRIDYSLWVDGVAGRAVRPDRREGVHWARDDWTCEDARVGRR